MRTMGSMRVALLALLLVLVGCDGEPRAPDDSGAVVADAGVDSGVLPVCVELTEDPTCEGTCEGFFTPRCPPDWAPACSDGSARWRIGYPGGVASCIIRQGPPSCDGAGAVPACDGATYRPVCLAPVVLEGHTCSSPSGF